MESAEKIMQKRPSNRITIKLTPEIHRDGEWYVGSVQKCQKLTGKGAHAQSVCKSLKEAVLLLMEDRRADAARKPIAEARALAAA